MHRYVLKNIALINNKIRIVLVNQWDDKKIGKDHENITIVHSDKLIAAHLYDQLPNVPLVAQNVGLGQGEIMEVHVPFGSAYAYRHIGSILQRKWKIAALYRDEKQILPTNATMIRPNDTLLIIGKPIVLRWCIQNHQQKNRSISLNHLVKIFILFWISDMIKKMPLLYLKESIYLVEKLEEKALFVRILYPNNFELIDELKSSGIRKSDTHCLL